MTIVVCVLWLLYLLVLKRAGWKHAASAPTVFFVAIVVVCLPWTLRNLHQFQRWFFIRDNFGLELYISNNNLASSSDAVSRLNGTHSAMHPDLNPAEAEWVKRLGEVEYNRDRLARHSTGSVLTRAGSAN